MRKALCVGIDAYKTISDLYGCVNDANEVKSALERNGDGTLNFSTRLMCSTSENSYVVRGDLIDALRELFQSESEVALFYFAGHGSIEAKGGYLCTSEVKRPDDGVSLNDIMTIVGESKARNNIIILDSCFSGAIANKSEMQNYSVLHDGTTILAACGHDEYSSEENNRGVFTSLLVEALYGGAMNLLGEVSPGSVYSYVDQSLGPWDQRPVFKANIKEFVSLRKNTPPIQLSDLRKISEIFSSPYEEYKLDETYEPDKHESENKELNKEHEEIFSILQQYAKLNLVVPVGEMHMYYAAIHNKSCKLTAQGQHYWKLAKINQI